jgi:signal peptidase I
MDFMITCVSQSNNVIITCGVRKVGDSNVFKETKNEIIKKIDNEDIYYTKYPDTKVNVVNGKSGKYLRTDSNKIEEDNLDNVKSC